MAKKKHPDKLITSTVYVEGMHCASCEVLIEKKLLKHEGIESVNASLKKHQVDFTYKNESKPSIDALNKEFSELGYRFSNDKKTHTEHRVFDVVNGNIVYNPQKVAYYGKLLVVAIGLLVAFFLFERLQLGQYVSVDASSALPAFFALGIVAGLSSCAALVGGLLLSMIKQWNELYIDADSTVQKVQPHFMFHIGRILSFVILGGVLGLVGEVLSLNNATFFAILTIVVSLIMFVLALQMLGVEWAQKFSFTAPKSFTQFAADENNFKGKYMPFAIGALTFFLPCGFTLIAQTIALASGSFIQGSLIMLFFVVGTLPALAAISYSGLIFNAKPHLTARFNIIAGIVVLFFVMYNINGQLNVLGYPSLSDISFEPQQQAESTPQESITGVQQLKIVAKGFSYTPESSTTIQSGIPTKLIVDNQGIQGCGAFIAARGLIDTYVALQNGINEIDLGVPTKGTYKLTCSMGMVAPITITVL